LRGRDGVRRWNARRGGSPRPAGATHDDRPRAVFQPRGSARTDRRYTRLRRSSGTFTAAAASSRCRATRRCGGFAGVSSAPDGTIPRREDWAGEPPPLAAREPPLVRRFTSRSASCDLPFTRTPAGSSPPPTASAKPGVSLGLQPPGLGATLRRSLDLSFPAKFQPDGRRSATASADGTAWCWTPATWHPLRTMVGSHTANWVSALVWSPDGRRCATACRRHDRPLWRPRTGRALPRLRGHPSSSTTSVQPGRPRLFTGSDDGTARSDVCHRLQPRVATLAATRRRGRAPPFHQPRTEPSSCRRGNAMATCTAVESRSGCHSCGATTSVSRPRTRPRSHPDGAAVS